MKKPHSLYLSMLAHNRLSAYVENALAGAGSLSGLFAFIEEHTQAMLARSDDLPWEHPANEKFETLALLDYRSLRQPLSTYLKAWDEFSAALPWFVENPVGAHILAMHPLTEFPSLWESEYRRRDRPRHDLDMHPVKISLVIGQILRPYAPSVHAFDRSEDGWRRARPILGRDRIDFIVADRQVPVSIYLDTEAHQTFYGAFGNRFFTRLEHALINLLEDPDAVFDIESAALFLELGPDSIDLEELLQTANVIALDRARYVTHVRPEKWPELTNAQLTKYVRKAGYESLQDRALVRDGLNYLYLRKRDIDRTQGYDIWYATPEAAEGTLATLHLGNQLGLIDGADIRLLPQRIAVALLERFGITEVAPTRDNAYRLLAGAAVNHDHSTTFDNAVDAHMWALFTLYARHCLGRTADDDPRVSQRTLATLAEGDLFPRVGAIEAFTGTKARRTTSGVWQLRRGRTIHAELDHRTLLRVGDALQNLVQLRDPITLPGDYDNLFEEPEKSPSPQPYSYPVSPTVIDRALSVLAIHDDETAHQALVTELRQEPPRRKRTRSKSKPIKDAS